MSHRHITTMFRFHACQESFGACLDLWTPWDEISSQGQTVVHTGATMVHTGTTKKTLVCGFCVFHFR